MRSINKRVSFFFIFILKIVSISFDPRIMDKYCKIGNSGNNDIISESMKEENFIAKGAFGKVYKVPESNPALVMKVIKLKESRDSLLIYREIAILEKLKRYKASSPKYYEEAKNLVSLSEHKECYYFKNELFIFIEKYEVDLDNFLSDKNEIKLNPVWMILASYSLVNIVRNMHLIGIIHADIKPENVFMKSPFELFIGDYSLSLDLDEIPKGKIYHDEKGNFGETRLRVPSAYGTAGYEAPEISKQKSISKVSDIYSLGMLLFDIFDRISSEQRENSSINSVCSNYDQSNEYTKDYAFILIEIYCLYYHSLINRMINLEPKSRINDDELKTEINNCTRKAISHYNQFMQQKLRELNDKKERLTRIETNPLTSLDFWNEGYKYLLRESGFATNNTPLLVEEVQYDESMIDKYSIDTFLRRMYQKLVNSRDNSNSYIYSVLSDYKIFFYQLSDLGQGIIGCTIDDYLNGNCVEEDNETNTKMYSIQQTYNPMKTDPSKHNFRNII